MRSLTWRVGCAAITLAALISYPRASFAIDCSYGGTIDPPLTDTTPHDGFCEAGKLKSLDPSAKSRTSISTKGSVIVPIDSPLEIVAPFSINVRQQPPGFPPIFLAGSFVVDHSVLSTIGGSASTGDIRISAGGDIFNDVGVFSLVAPFNDVRLRAMTRVLLLGPNLGPALTNPSTLILADDVKLSANLGDIEVQNASITGYSGGIDLAAPRGNITVHNTVFFSIQDRVNRVGFCRFSVQTKDHVVIGKVFGIIDNPDPTNILVCTPVLKH